MKVIASHIFYVSVVKKWLLEKFLLTKANKHASAWWEIYMSSSDVTLCCLVFKRLLVYRYWSCTPSTETTNRFCIFWKKRWKYTNCGTELNVKNVCLYIKLPMRKVFPQGKRIHPTANFRKYLRLFFKPTFSPRSFALICWRSLKFCSRICLNLAKYS